jgi:hypothetical protein
MVGVSRDRTGILDVCERPSRSLLLVPFEMLRVVAVNFGRRLVDNVCRL